jgi:hypothetical protein
MLAGSSAIDSAYLYFSMDRLHDPRNELLYRGFVEADSRRYLAS